MADITIDPLDHSTPSTGTTLPRPGRARRTVVLGALAFGGLIGSVTTVVANDGHAGSPPAAQATSPASTTAGRAVGADDAWGRTTSADALARWAEADRRARLELCTGAPTSADALERCMAG